MDGNLIVTIIGSTVAIVATLIGATWKLSAFINGLSTELREEIKQVEESTDVKRARVYERLDEYKKITDATYMRKDMAEILQNQLLKNNDELKSMLKDFIVEMRARCLENHSVGV